MTVYENIPDSAGMNAYRADPTMADLLPIYLEPDLMDTVSTELDRMGGLVGDHLEKLALSADKNPPVLSIRARNGAPVETVQKHPSFEELERYAFGEFGLAAMSHRDNSFRFRLCLLKLLVVEVLSDEVSETYRCFLFNSEAWCRNAVHWA